MPVSEGYLTFVLDQLRPVVPAVRARRMFGGIGLYASDLFFGIVDDDIVYLKVDDSTRGEYEARGMPAFRPHDGAPSMNYNQLPEEVLEELESLREWASRSLDIARAARSNRSKAKSPKRSAGKPNATKPSATKASATKKTSKKTSTTKTSTRKTSTRKTSARKAAKKKRARKRVGTKRIATKRRRP